MRAFAVLALCLVFACGTKPPPLPGAHPIEATSVDAGAAPQPPTATNDDSADDAWTPPVCAMPKSGCAALEPKVGSITMERTACYGHCPIYTVTIKSDGTVTWHGEMFVDAKDDETSHADPKDVADLFALVGTSCFSSFKGEYTSPKTDHPWAHLTLEVDGRTKVVKHYLALYREDDAKRKCDDIDKLLSIEKKIDVVAKTKKLIGNGGKTPP